MALSNSPECHAIPHIYFERNAWSKFAPNRRGRIFVMLHRASQLVDGAPRGTTGLVPVLPQMSQIAICMIFRCEVRSNQIRELVIL